MMSVRFRLPAPILRGISCLSLFNFAQFADQGLPLIRTMLLTSLSTEARMYGFIAFIAVNIPGIYFLYVTELWWILTLTPVWLFLNFKGFYINWKVTRNS